MARDPDWAKTGTVEGYAEWLRGKSDALCVLVIRPHDSVFAVDPGCSAADAGGLCAEYLPRLMQRVEHARKEKRKAGRLELGPCPE